MNNKRNSTTDKNSIKVKYQKKKKKLKSNLLYY